VERPSPSENTLAHNKCHGTDDDYGNAVSHKSQLSVATFTYGSAFSRVDSYDRQGSVNSD
jgi:hypothetical protein